MTFTTTHEVLISVTETKGVRYVMEAQVSKIYATAAEALPYVDYSEGFAFYVLNVRDGKFRDVTEEMAQAYLDRFEPDPEEWVPVFVRDGTAYEIYLEEYEQ